MLKRLADSVPLSTPPQPKIYQSPPLISSPALPGDQRSGRGQAASCCPMKLTFCSYLHAICIRQRGGGGEYDSSRLIKVYRR
jgi:hypothetical protein